MQNNLKIVKKIAISLEYLDGKDGFPTFPHWRLRVVITPRKGEKIGSERVIDEEQLIKSRNPMYSIDYAWEVIRKMVQGIINTGKFPDGRT